MCEQHSLRYTFRILNEMMVCHGAIRYSFASVASFAAFVFFMDVIKEHLSLRLRKAITFVCMCEREGFRLYRQEMQIIKINR